MVQFFINLFHFVFFFYVILGGVNKEIENAFRIDFDGYYNMPNTSFIYRISESLVLNILSITQIDENLDVKVQPTTGIGCPDYFQLEREFPKLTTRQLHFTFTETLTSDLNSSKTILNVEVNDFLIKIIIILSQ